MKSPKDRYRDFQKFEDLSDSIYREYLSISYQLIEMRD